MYFAYWKAKKLSVVELEQFSETRQVLGYVDLICSGVMRVILRASLPNAEKARLSPDVIAYAPNCGTSFSRLFK